MGGKPYGRPMAMTADDVDDLALGDVPTALGPFFPGLPGGLGIDLRMQGQRVRTVDAVDDPGGPSPRPRIRPLRSPRRNAGASRRGCPGPAIWWPWPACRRWGGDSWWPPSGPREAGGAAAAGRIDALFRRAERGRLADLISGVGRIDADTVERLGLEGPLARALRCAARRKARRPGLSRPRLRGLPRNRRRRLRPAGAWRGAECRQGAGPDRPVAASGRWRPRPSRRCSQSRHTRGLVLSREGA